MIETKSLKQTRKEWNDSNNDKRIELLSYAGISLGDNICKEFDSLSRLIQIDLIDSYDQKIYNTLLQDGNA